MLTMEETPNDIKIKLALTLEEMYFGVTKKVTYQKRDICTSCRGRNKCSHCRGRKIALKETITELEIPSGIAEGMELTKADAGHVFYKNNVKSLFRFFKQKASYGKLRIEFEEIKHPIYSRMAYHLILPYELRKEIISKKDIVIEVPCMSNRMLKVRIPQNTPNGKIFRVNGKGFNNLIDGGLGDLLICIEVR